MKLGKRLLTSAVLIYVIAAVLLNLVVFAVFKPFELQTDNMKLVFWFSYGFMMLAFVLQFVALLTGRLERGVESAFFGFPLVQVALFYFLITTILSVAFMALVSFAVEIPFMLMLVLECLVLGIYVIIFIMSLAAKDAVITIDKTIKKNVFAIRSLASDVGVLAESVDNPQLKARLARLEEDIKYSDPMTNASVADLDLQIRDGVAELEVYVTGGDNADAEQQIKKLQLLISKRNRRLADGK